MSPAPKPALELIKARAPGLVYVSDDSPGITRHRRGKSFTYRHPDGSALRETAELDRIRRLAVPPAYTSVWICPDPHGHLQATGRDARGRKQYRYHTSWRETKDEQKFDRMLEFAAALPKIRKRVASDLAQPAGTQLMREAVLAAIVRLLDATMLRIGNEEYARSNGSYGLTTLQRRHAALKGNTLRLSFRGKSGVEREVAVDDPAVARIVRRCQTLRGQALFRYVDPSDAAGSAPRAIGSADVNDYLRSTSGSEITAKDFRTWHGSVHALALALDAARQDGAGSAAAKAVLTQVAARLGNTVAVCRKAYVHPRVLGLLMGEVEAPNGDASKQRRSAGLTADERRLLAFIEVATPVVRMG